MDIVERFNANIGPHGVRQDFMGIFDLIAATPNKGIVGIQCTGQHGHAAHRRKLLESENTAEWLRSGGKAEVWSWRKVKAKRGGVLRVWRPRIEEITLEMVGD